jgi:hypothetical protein
MTSEEKSLIARVSIVVAVLAVALGLNGCVGVVVVAAGSSFAAAGGLYATDKDRNTGADNNTVPPAERVPPAQQVAPQASADLPQAAPRQSVTVQPLR